MAKNTVKKSAGRTEKPVRRVGRLPIQEIETRVVRFGNLTKKPEGVVVDSVNVVEGQIPGDYHCRCEYCARTIGELIRSDGSYYSRLERRGYYDPIESGKDGHAAKTPLHVARWAVQRYTRVGDWVLDPTMGAGTTAVESLVQGRSAAGMELQYEGIIAANVGRHAVGGRRAIIGFGDARNLGGFLRSAKVPRPTLVVNNPPYSGDEHWSTFNVPKDANENTWSATFGYDGALPNLAFLKEGDEYWSTMSTIYRSAVEHLLPGGHLVIAVKDMMRRKAPFMLHKYLCEVISRIEGLSFVGTAFLRHHPPTLHLSTYGKIHGVEPPKYQTINVFKKGEKED